MIPLCREIHVILAGVRFGCAGIGFFLRGSDRRLHERHLRVDGYFLAARSMITLHWPNLCCLGIKVRITSLNFSLPPSPAVVNVMKACVPEAAIDEDLFLAAVYLLIPVGTLLAVSFLCGCCGAKRSGACCGCDGSLCLIAVSTH